MSGDPEWRSKDQPSDPLRDFIRSALPKGPNGFVVEDLDIVTRSFGFMYGLDAKGRVRLIEVKFGFRTEIGTSKEMTFGLLDEMLRRGDTEGRYDGYYVLRHECAGEWTMDERVKINKSMMTADGLVGWLQTGEPYVDPLWASRCVAA